MTQRKLRLPAEDCHLPGMGPFEFAKVTADYYYSLRQYGTALSCYEKLLDDRRNTAADDEFLGRVWNNIGACYAGLFWFDKPCRPMRCPGFTEKTRTR